MGTAPMFGRLGRSAIPTLQQQEERVRHFELPILRLAVIPLGIELLGFAWQGLGSRDTQIKAVYGRVGEPPELEIGTWSPAALPQHLAYLDPLDVAALEFVAPRAARDLLATPEDHEAYELRVKALVRENGIIHADGSEAPATVVTWPTGDQIAILSSGGATYTVATAIGLSNQRFTIQPPIS